jgi:DNA polymerase elongation subunit (family B)
MDYSILSDDELEALYLKIYNEVSKFGVQRQSSKILANSLFGALTNAYMRWVDIRLGESITKTGQVAIQWVQKDLNEYLNKAIGTVDFEYIIGIDTDSNLLTLNPLIEKIFPEGTPDEEIVEFICNLCDQKLDKVIAKSFDEFSDYTGYFEKKIKMGRDIVANKGIWTGKKHYALNVFDKEGLRYPTPKLIIKGLESQRSSTPAAYRKGIKEAVNIIMNKEEKDLIDFVEEFKTKVFPINEIAFPKGINGMKKYGNSETIYSKGTPAQVKGSLIYNALLKSRGIDDKYPEINDGDKIKFVYLTDPNPIFSTIISFPGRNIPKELKLDDYIDKYALLEKGFLKPIRSITDAIGWKCEKKSDLSKWFN